MANPMTKPGRREHTPSDEIARFTNREDEQRIFQLYLSSPTEPPVLMFYGIGGAGKTWLLKKLRQQIPTGLPAAYLDFDMQAGGQRFVLDPAAALYDIRQQIGRVAPRFDLAFAMLRYKQGASEEPGMWGHGALSLAMEIAADVVQATGKFVPGVNVLLKRLSPQVLARIKGSSFERFLARGEASQFVLELRGKTSQEIGNDLLHSLAADLRESLTPNLSRAVRVVLLFDTFEAVGAGLLNAEHRRFREKWVRDVAANFDFALTVIAGQNRLDWAEGEPTWEAGIEQHLVGGLSEADARQFLSSCEIDGAELQEVILATARETDGDGYHCFSLGLCADIVYSERRSGREPEPETLRLRPQDWEALARRFLKSLASDLERRWIERLALTPRFDERAGREAFSKEHSSAQDEEWDGIGDYSFVQPLAEQGGWYAIRAQMRWAMENQPSAHVRVKEDHERWQSYWTARIVSSVDDAASLAWYHYCCLDLGGALEDWNRLAVGARTSKPPRMREHFKLLQWWEPVGLMDATPSTPAAARALSSLGAELWHASLGNRSSILRHAIACHDAALRVYSEQAFPREWAWTQNNLGLAYWDLPNGDRAANLRQAIAGYEAALRVYTEVDFPPEWAETQDNLGVAWWDLPTGEIAEKLSKSIACFNAALRVYTKKAFSLEWAQVQNDLGNALSDLPTGDRNANLRQAIAQYEDALSVRTEQDFPYYWAETQNNLGSAWSDLPSGSRNVNLRRSIACYEAVLRVYTEQDYPRDWARTQYNLGSAWADMPTGDRAANLHHAITYYGGALRVYTEQEYPQEWAMTQNATGAAWSDLPTGDRAENLRQAIVCYEATLRVYTELDFPYEWAGAQNNLGQAWSELLTGDRTDNLRRAIAYYEAALSVYTEQGLPQDWAMAQNNLGAAWADLPTGDRTANLRQAISYYEASLRVYTEQEFPRDWADAQNNLGEAWAELPAGDRTASLQRAIAYCEAALRVYTEQELPWDWAMTQGNLGGAWSSLPTDDHAANLHRAIEYYERALRIYTEQDFPEDYKRLTQGLRVARDKVPRLPDNGTPSDNRGGT
jgi:hypothetical protein